MKKYFLVFITAAALVSCDVRRKDKIVDDAYYAGLLLLGCGEATIRFCPPLCITKVEAETGLDILSKIIGSK